MKGEQSPVSLRGRDVSEELFILFIICTLSRSRRNQTVQEISLFLFHQVSFLYARVIPSYHIYLQSIRLVVPASEGLSSIYFKDLDEKINQ